MDRELIFVIAVCLVIWIYSLINMIKPGEMINKYYMITPKDILREYIREYNFFTRINQITLIVLIVYLIYYFCFK